jgi:hypothetical protein
VGAGVEMDKCAKCARGAEVKETQTLGLTHTHLFRIGALGSHHPHLGALWDELARIEASASDALTRFDLERDKERHGCWCARSEVCVCVCVSAERKVTQKKEAQKKVKSRPVITGLKHVLFFYTFSLHISNFRSSCLYKPRFEPPKALYTAT